MASSELRKIPKVEFHRHLDGSVRTQTIIDLAKKNNIDLGCRNESELIKKTKVTTPMKDLDTVLAAFWTHQKVLCNYEAIKRVTFENVEDAYQDGVKLLELRFAPTFISEGKNLKNDEIIEGVIDGMTEGLEKYDIQVGLIHIVARDLDRKRNLEATKDILRYKNSHHRNADRLVGLDLASVESASRPKEYLEFIQMARAAGLKVTIHSGEDTSAQLVLETLLDLSPDRIGHGIRTIESKEVIELVKDRDVLLEVCPTSNYLTKSVASIEEHPFPKLLNLGVPVSLNSDDPQLMGIDLVTEYRVAHEVFDLSIKELFNLNLRALKYSFLPPEISAHVKVKSFS